MARRKHAAAMYEAAEYWRDNCLLKDGSVFGDKTLWSRENFDEDFEKRFVDFLVPETESGGAGGSSIEQWRDFLKAISAPATIHQLMGEIVWVMDLIDCHTRPPAKLRRIQEMSQWSGAELPLEHKFLQDEYLHGTAKLGGLFAITYWFELLIFILFVREIKLLSPTERQQLLTGDGKKLSRLWDEWPEKWRTQWPRQWDAHTTDAKKTWRVKNVQIRHIMLHMIFPDHFEPVVSSGHKREIVKMLSNRKPQEMSWTEIDETIQAIRKEQEKIHGTPLGFYGFPLTAKWHPNWGGAGRIENSGILEKDEIASDDEWVKAISLNRIFYGPPGTGKTYRTVSAALEILDSEFYESHHDDRKAIKSRFEQLKENGRIGIVTFHQSFGYEEFVEGIRPNMDDGEQETISYQIRSGIFKIMCERAAMSTHEPLTNFEQAMNSLKEECEEETITINSVRNRIKFFVSLREGGNAFLMHRQERDPEKSKPLYIESIRKVFFENLNRGGRPRVNAVLKYLKQHHGLIDLQSTAKSVTDVESLPHVLIIDEINRGNISRIFGELITLIEESKRIGNAEATTVSLPYSGEDFGVPKNLYIIGTMNTADRSIALLDTALRRRFRFIEMMPVSDLLDGIDVDGIDIAKLLFAMNARIEAIYDRDHQIGHAYFLRLAKQQNIETLTDIFQYEIFPLLQEYFYDDWEKIDLVLNKNGFLSQKKPPKMSGDAVIDDKKIWLIDPGALRISANYQKIYADAADDNAA